MTGLQGFKQGACNMRGKSKYHSVLFVFAFERAELCVLTFSGDLKSLEC